MTFFFFGFVLLFFFGLSASRLVIFQLNAVVAFVLTSGDVGFVTSSGGARDASALSLSAGALLFTGSFAALLFLRFLNTIIPCL